MHNTMIKFGMLLALWAAVGAVLYLGLPASYHTPKFWLAVGTLALASALFFTRGILRRPAAWGTMGAEADDARLLVSAVYGVAVVVLAVIAMIPLVPFGFMLACHILAALILVFGWGFLAMARHNLETPHRSVAMNPRPEPVEQPKQEEAAG